MENNPITYSDSKIPKTLQDLYSQTGWNEKKAIWEAEQRIRDMNQQMRLNELLKMIDSGMQLDGLKGGPYTPNDAEKYINSNGRWM